MTTTGRKPTLKLVPNGPPLAAEMIFDSPREGTNDHGPWWAFTVRLIDAYPAMGGALAVGEEVTFFAPNAVIADQLKAFSRGDQFTLSVTQEPGRKRRNYSVSPYGGAVGPRPAFADEDDPFRDLPLDEQPIYPGKGEAPAEGPRPAPPAASTERPRRTPAPGTEPRTEVDDEYTETYAKAFAAAFYALRLGVDTIADEYGPRWIKDRLREQIDLEAIQRTAATLFIESNRQRRTDQIGRERRGG